MGCLVYLEKVKLVEKVVDTPVLNLLVSLAGGEDLGGEQSRASNGRNERRSHG